VTINNIYLLVHAFCSDSSYLRRAGQAVYDAMFAADTNAIWLACLLLLP